MAASDFTLFFCISSKSRCALVKALWVKVPGLVLWGWWVVRSGGMGRPGEVLGVVLVVIVPVLL